jgi:acetylornithine/succinyldiaminopimelate/putrescine aminotransferase
MVTTYARPTPVFARGAGCHLWDADGRRYLDLTAGIAVNSLGHCDPQVAEILHEQVPSLLSPPPHAPRVNSADGGDRR